MGNNDLILLDSILKKMNENDSSSRDKGKQFELFALDQILKDYDLSGEEIEFGLVDGSDDGGIDGFYTFIDGRLIIDPIDADNYRRNVEVEVLILTSKHKDTFQQSSISSIFASVKELFDLSLETDDIQSPFNEDVLYARELFRKSYIELAANNPNLKVRYVYVSRGSTKKIASNVKARAQLLTKETKEFFDQSVVSFDFIGAAELLSLHRKTRQFSLRLKFVESPISRSNNSYIVLCRIDEFCKFVSDSDGKLRRYLFDSNVRDYLEGSLINRDIATTLASVDTKESMDFWLLNNGVTILTSNTVNIGKELSLENIQIVNGLQTTETIYKHFNNNGKLPDDRAVLVKVIVANDEVLRDRIIKATNNQNKVDISNLKATDKLQKDIEELLLEQEWYYDRRKNYYRNLDKPQHRIISVAYLCQAILALCLRELEMAGKSKPNYMTNENTYSKLFNEKWNIKVYLALVEIRKSMENSLAIYNLRNGQDPHYNKRFAMLITYVYVVVKLGRIDYKPDNLISIMHESITEEEVKYLLDFTQRAIDSYKEKFDVQFVKRPQRNSKFLRIIQDQLKTIL